MKISLLNGEKLKLSLNNRGLAYGDGVFETLLANTTGPQHLERHLKRLAMGAHALGLEWDRNYEQTLSEKIQCFWHEFSIPHVIKIIVIRNCNGRGYDYDPLAQSTDVILQISPFEKPAWSTIGANVIVSDTYISENRSLAGIKHLNRLDSVLARQFARKFHADEAIMTNKLNEVVECSAGNLFFKIDGRWCTPDLIDAGVAGIIRALILENHDDISICRIKTEQLAKVESAFLCNSLMGVVPIKQLNGRRLDQHEDIIEFKKEIGIT